MAVSAPFDLEQLTYNIAVYGGRCERVIVSGREFLKAHATIIVPGVLNGSKGALYYPDEECEASAHVWNGKPLTMYHPTDPVTNNPLSADSPGVWDRQGIGRIRNTRFDGKLRTEAFFDVERLKSADRRFGTDVLNRLLNGQPIELSTGLYTQNVLAPLGANHNGRPYDYVAKNYRADHLAILPDQVGACSLNDGCGVLVNQKAKPKPPTKPPCPPGGT